MEPTLDVGQRVLVSRFNYKFSDPDRGDIVVFHPPKGANSNTAGCRTSPRTRPARGPSPRRTASTSSSGSWRCPATRSRSERPRDRQRQAAEGISPGPARPERCNFPRPIKIPPGHFFMMGDNRGASDDSRFWGPVPEKWIIGQAFFTYWPPSGSGSSKPSGPAARRPRAACSASTATLDRRYVAGADEAGRGSLAGPLVAAAVLFDYERLALREVRALCAARRLEGARPRAARGALPARDAGGRAGRGHVALRARHRRARAARHEPRGAARLPGARRGARTASASSTASACRRSATSSRP